MIILVICLKPVWTVSISYHQIGRSTESPIDFVVTDTVAGSQSNADTQSVQSTISRFACRIKCQRTPPYTARIYAAGFDSSKNIFLGVSCVWDLCRRMCESKSQKDEAPQIRKEMWQKIEERREIKKTFCEKSLTCFLFPVMSAFTSIKLQHVIQTFWHQSAVYNKRLLQNKSRTKSELSTTPCSLFKVASHPVEFRCLGLSAGRVGQVPIYCIWTTIKFLWQVLHDIS